MPLNTSGGYSAEEHEDTRQVFLVGILGKSSARLVFSVLVQCYCQGPYQSSEHETRLGMAIDLLTLPSESVFSLSTSSDSRMC